MTITPQQPPSETGVEIFDQISTKSLCLSVLETLITEVNEASRKHFFNGEYVSYGDLKARIANLRSARALIEGTDYLATSVSSDADVCC